MGRKETYPDAIQVAKIYVLQVAGTDAVHIAGEDKYARELGVCEFEIVKFLSKTHDPSVRSCLFLKKIIYKKR